MVKGAQVGLGLADQYFFREVPTQTGSALLIFSFARLDLISHAWVFRLWNMPVAKLIGMRVVFLQYIGGMGA